MTAVSLRISRVLFLFTVVSLRDCRCFVRIVGSPRESRWSGGVRRGASEFRSFRVRDPRTLPHVRRSFFFCFFVSSRSYTKLPFPRLFTTRAHARSTKRRSSFLAPRLGRFFSSSFSKRRTSETYPRMIRRSSSAVTVDRPLHSP